MPLIQGTRLGLYEILGPLGAGGMGQVYRARDTKLGREVAIKVLQDDYASDPGWLSRFDREARLLAALNHANIATVHGLDEVAGVRFLVMELVPGLTLAERLETGPLAVAEALGLCRQIAEALEAAHEKGIIHRDLKPANVKITPEGKVKVLDFGLAKTTEPFAAPSAATAVYDGQTAEGVIVGTPAYMAPEQARGRPLDRRCDVWAFGCVLYEALVGRPTFGGETFSDILAAVIERNPDLTALPPGVPPRVIELLRRCLQKDPQRRMRDMGDARLEIEESLADLAKGPGDSSPPPPPTRPTARWPAVVFPLVLALALFPLGMLVQARWIRPSSAEEATGPAPAAPVGWTGQLLLGGAMRAFGPRVSPDGQWVAFLVLQEGQSQVAVMKLGSGEWWVLTHDRSRGLVNDLCWSADSDRIYYDRFFDVPTGIFSVRPLDVISNGGRERLVVDQAECPQIAADGSLLVCRHDAGGNSSLRRIWLNGEREESAVLAHPIEFSPGWPSAVRALRSRQQAVFCGRLLDGTEKVPPRRLYLLDLESGKTRLLYPEPIANELVALTVSPDDRFVYTALPAGDLYQVVRIPLTEEGGPQTVVTVTEPVFGLDVDAQGRLFLDQFRRPLELLRFSAFGGQPERLASRSRGRVVQPVEFSGDCFLLPSRVSGRDRLLLALPHREPVPLLDEGGQTRAPVAAVGADRVAFVAGPEGSARVQLAVIEEDHGRLERTLASIPAAGLSALATSPDGKTIYWVRAKAIWEAPIDGSRPPRKRSEGDGVAVHPNGKELVVQHFEGQGVRLFRLPLAGGERTEIRVQGSLRLAPDPIGSQAIHADGRILVATASRDSWFWRPAVLDPATGKLERIPVDFDDDIYPANWGRDGKVLGMAFSLRSDLWRLTPQE